MTRHPHATRLLILPLILIPLTVQARYVVSKKKPQQIILANFEEAPLGKFYTPLRTYPFQRDKARQIYKVAQEGKNQFLRAVDEKDLSTPVFFPLYWDIENYPTLKWRWRARKIPKGANELNRETNDSACGVYVIVGQFTGKLMKYIWSSTLPVGTIVPKDERSRMLVIETGESRKDQWLEVTVNVVEDYKRFFGEEMKDKPSGIGFLTDGNAVHAPAACDYDDFTILYSPSSLRQN